MTDFRLDHLRASLRERYAFEAFLGSGAFATVYLVRNLRLERQEALKVLSAAHTEDPSFKARFISEAKMVASLDHPGIVQVYDYGEAGGILWYTMQLIDGPTLHAEQAARGLFSEREAARLAIPVLEALAFSHERGIVHRDIKPSNVILNRLGRTYLMDFGIAKIEGSQLKTMTGNVLGTPAYVSPEQVEGKKLDGRGDLYSLGVTLYQMVSGRLPFESEEPLQAVVARLMGDAEPLSARKPDVAPGLEEIVMRALRRDPEERFRDADAMREALETVAGDGEEAYLPAAETPEREPLPPLTEPEMPQTKSPSPASRKRRTWAAAAALAAAVLVGWYVFAPGPAPERPASGPTDPAGVEDPGSTVARPAEAGSTAGAALPVEEPPTETQPSDEGGSGKAAGTGSGEADPVRQAAQPASAQEPPTPPPPAPEPPRRAVEQPLVLTRMEPDLAAEHGTLCAGVTVSVSLRVGAAGEVERVRVLNEGPEPCIAAAVAAAKEYLFEPGRDYEGNPVPASVAISIQFPEESP